MVHSFNQKLIIMLKEKKINAGQWSEVVVQSLLLLGHEWSCECCQDPKDKVIIIGHLGLITRREEKAFTGCTYPEMSVAGVLRYASTELISRKNHAGEREYVIPNFRAVPEALLGRDFDEKNHAADAMDYAIGGLTSGPYHHGYVISTGGRRSGRTFGLEELLDPRIIIEHNPRGRHWLHEVMGTLDTPRKPYTQAKETTNGTDFYYEGKIVNPFDRVLVRDNDKAEWRIGFFSHIKTVETFRYLCSNGSFKHCIPYAGNENLLGTTKNP